MRFVWFSVVCAALALAFLSDGPALGVTAPASQAYRNESREQALATVRQKFPALLDAPALTWPARDVGAQIKGYLNPETAVVGSGSARRGVLESSIPLRGQTPDGASAPIDLGLVDAGSASYAPRSAATSVRIPANAQDKLRFPDASFGVGLDGAQSQAATISQNKAFFPNVAQDADLVLEPKAQGAELSVVLRSPAAPTKLPLAFDLAPGQQLRLADATDADPLPPGSVELVDGAKRIAAIYPASATDADGQTVPVTYKLDGNRLLIELDTSGDISWPVLVDPTIGVYDNNGNSAGAGTPGYTWPNWKPEAYITALDTTGTTWSYCNNQASNPSKKFYFCQGTTGGASWSGGPLYIKANANQTYALNNFAQWAKEARKDPDGNSYAYIYRLDAAGLDNVGPFQAHLAVGVRTADASGWERGSVLLADGTTTSTGDTVNVPPGSAAYRTPDGTALVAATRYLKVHSGQPADASDPITPGNKAVLKMIMDAGAPGTPLPFVQLDGAATYSSETRAPSLDQPTHANPPPGGWVDSYSDTVSTAANDKGLGMGTISLTGPGIAADTGASDCPQNGGPTGTKNSYDGCKLNLTMPGKTYTAPEGINNYRIAATDLVGNHDGNQDAAWTVKVDNTAPSVQLSGPLYDSRGTTLADGQYNLHVDATDGTNDGNPAHARSGVKSVEISVDGEQQDYVEQDCVSDSCSLGRDWVFDTAEFAGGQHTIEVNVTDELGHEAPPQTFTVNRPCCFAAASAWPTVSIGTAEVIYADVDGDGHADMVTRDRLTGALQLRLSTGDSFDPAQPWGTWDLTYDLRLGDVNGDGHVDVIGWNSVTGDVRVALSDGHVLGAPTSWATWPTSRNLFVADIDGDGAVDLAGRDLSTGDISIAYSDGESAFEPPLSIGSWPASYSLSFADVNGDERADAIGRDAASGDVRVALQADTGLLPASTWGTLPGAYDVAYGDVNGDSLADVVARSQQSGDIRVLESTDASFTSASSWGTWSPTFSLELADVTGDGASDIVGQDAFGTVSSAGSVAPTPASPSAQAFTADEDDAELPPDPAPVTTAGVTPRCPVSSTQTAGKHHNLLIAYQDDQKLLERFGLATYAPGESQFDNGSGEQKAECAINHLYDRMRESGASVVRFIVWWGRHQNRDGSYYWPKLDEAIDMARANGFKVYLTLSGAVQNDCAPLYNTNGRGCDQPTGVNPSPDDFRQFVQAVVNRYTHDPAAPSQPLVRVQYFGLWNEPNLSQHLTGTPSQERNKVLPASLYGRLYGAGYLGYLDGLNGVSGTRVLIGDLAARERSARGADKAGTCGQTEAGTRKCLYTASDFLAQAVPAASAYLSQTRPGVPLRADGVALHPYQQYVAPWQAGHDTLYRGIGRLHQFNQEMRALGLKRQDGNNAKLYLTEFGYFNRQQGSGRPRTYHRETTRRAWFGGGRAADGKRGALRQALDHHALMMNLYHLTELPPQNNQDTMWDGGLIAQPKDAGPNNDDINGCRPYGKTKDKRGWRIDTCPPTNSPKSAAQYRLAYCGIRSWAASWGFFDKRVAPYANGCL